MSYPISQLEEKFKSAPTEFECLPFEPSHEAVVASAQANRSKNRYINVVPYDCSRVKLTTPNDYINASFINGLTPNSEKAYVATQAPIPRTIEDFWQMVWEQDAKIIIMLGAEVENMRVKVDRYWPVDTPADQQVKQYGEFSVALCATEVYREANVTLRELEVTFRGEKKAVHHYQYSGWPDHDVPSTTLDLRQLIYSLHSRFGTPLPHPLVLHCSAGIGRTGTFCAVHMSFQYMLEMIRASREDEIRLDLFEIVKRLREQRHGMVQSLSQYAYCYQVLIDIAADLGLLTPDHPVTKPELFPHHEQPLRENGEETKKCISKGNNKKDNPESSSI